ncbi:MAG: tyrosine-type recombinase/integrase [bacterium]|nr:tyrosine-type recombinase/integrase [bacterium]
MTLQHAIEEFILAKQADGLATTTIKWYRSELKPLAAAYPERAIDTITPNDLRQYIVSMRDRDSRYVSASQRPKQAGGLSSASIAGHVRALHAFWAWAEREYKCANPMRNIRRPKVITPQPKSASMSDFVALFNAIGGGDVGTRNRALLAFLVDTGCRLGGLLSARISNLDLASCRAVITEKGNKQRKVYFTRFTGQLIYFWLTVRESDSDALFTSIHDGKPLTASGVHQMLKRLKAQANVRGRVNAHAFRHNFARSYISSGGDISTLAKILGHSDITTTAAYYAVFTEDELAQMHREFSPLSHIDLNDLFHE